MALVALTVVAVAFGAWQLNRFTSTSVMPSSSSASGEVPADVPGSQSPGPSGTASGAPPVSPGPGVPGNSPTAAATDQPTSGADVDRSTPVMVHNGTKRTGLAGATAARLEELGWPASVGADEDAASVTTVYYPRSSLRNTAQDVANDLGGTPLLEQSTRYGAEQVTVILGPDAAD